MGWRFSGVPVGAAVAALVVAAVSGVLLLGAGPAGTGEVLVGGGTVSSGPGTPAAAADPVTSAASDDDLASVPVLDAPAQAGVEPVRTVPVSPAPAGPPGPAASSVPAGPLVVHVDGAVARPGVVSVPAGSRVGDAVEAAGGVTAEADTRLVNLARVLLDGEQVVVPRPGEEVAVGSRPVAPGGGGGPATGGGGEAGTGPAAPVDLNAADATALDALPGIGPVLAERIVSHREEVGPFGSVEDLESVRGIGPSLLSAVRDLVTV